MLKPGIDYIGVGVGAMIVERDRILLLKRSREPEAGCWGIQGGAVEFGETIEAAIVREVREELGVESEILTLLGVTNHILANGDIHWVSPVFLMSIAGIPENREPHKHSDLQWFDLTALPENITLTTQSALLFLQQYRNSPSDR